MAKKDKKEKKPKEDKKPKKPKSVKSKFKDAITLTVREIPYRIIPVDKVTHWEASIYIDLNYLGLVRAETQKDSIRKAENFINLQNASR